MTTSSKTMTADELWRIPSDGMRHELVNGELTTMAPAGANHGAIGFKIGLRIGNFVEANSLGVVVGADTGFTLRRNPDTVRAPDVAFVKASRIPQSGMTVNFFEGAPDLAVEVLSPSDTVEETEEKIEDYLRAGCEAVWVVNPKRRTVTIHQSQKNPTVLRESDTLDGKAVLPGFRCSVSEIFI